MRIGICLDWLAWSSRWDGDPYRDIPDNDFFAERSAMPPQKGYTMSRQRGPIAINWHPKHPEMRRFCVLSGKGLREMRASGRRDVETLAWVRSTGARITRMDVAIDIVGSDQSDPAQVMQSFGLGVGRSTTRSRNVVEKWNGDARTGYTVYLGSRESERFMRIYDKGAKEGHGDNWTRIEIETKGAVARLLAQQIEQDGLAAAAREMVRMCDPALPWYDRAMLLAGEGDAVSVGRKQTDSDRWLREVALPAVLQALARGDSYVESQIWGQLDKNARE